MTLTLRVPSDDEQAAWRVELAQRYVEEAWRRWVVESCVERHGGHQWVLELDDPRHGEPVADLRCEACPAGLADIGFDDPYYLWLDTDDGVSVAQGRHTSPRPAVVPVDAEPWWSKSWTDYGWDYDAGIELHQRGPVRYLDDSTAPSALVGEVAL